MSVNLDSVLKKYLKDDEVAKKVYGYLCGRKVSEREVIPSKIRRVFQLALYYLHVPVYRKRFKAALQKYVDAKNLEIRKATLKANIKDKKRAIKKTEAAIDRYTKVLEETMPFETNKTSCQELERPLDSFQRPVKNTFLFGSDEYSFTTVKIPLDNVEATLNYCKQFLEMFNEAFPEKALIVRKKDTRKTIQEGIDQLEEIAELHNRRPESYRWKSSDEITELRAKASEKKETKEAELVRLKAQLADLIAQRPEPFSSESISSSSESVAVEESHSNANIGRLPPLNMRLPSENPISTMSHLLLTPFTTNPGKLLERGFDLASMGARTFL